MFWITDQVVVDRFAGHRLVAWNAAVAWVAIAIDYLEMPVIVDTLGKVFQERKLIWPRIRRHLRTTPVTAGQSPASWRGASC